MTDNKPSENASHEPDRNDSSTVPAKPKSEAKPKEPPKPDEPLAGRVIHSVASTGSTAVARVVAALPNVMLINELSPNGLAHNRFSPLDPIEQALSRYPDFEFSLEDRLYFFSERFRKVIEHCDKKSINLVVRDHSHSDFMMEEQDQQPPVGSLIPAIRQVAPPGRIASVIVIRHPLASYITARKSNFLSMVSSLDEYCWRYMEFLDHYRGTPRIRFEQFAADAWVNLKAIANHLELEPKRAALKTFPAVKISGNSGRHGGDGSIHPVMMREVDEGMRDLAERSEAYAKLCKDLQYPADPLVYARVQLRALLDHNPSDADALAEYDRLKM